MEMEVKKVAIVEAVAGIVLLVEAVAKKFALVEAVLQCVTLVEAVVPMWLFLLLSPKSQTLNPKTLKP